MTASTEYTVENNEFKGKRILVTGGTKGMGEAIVNRLSRAGGTVLTTARSIPGDPRLKDRFI
ncbi:short-chain dehydrogenase, partial [Paenibacillus sepulcri]|nr:short-chain dehydrogenase [Paenibacillus sepulcri]